MYNYNDQIKAYHNAKVTIGEDIRSKLRQHREANQNRLIANIKKGVAVSKSSFVKQGSYANRTMVQKNGNDYDIDDGVIFAKGDLIGDRGAEMTPLQVRDMVLNAIKDDKFAKQPERLTNCVRVYYKEGHHVDIPSYRKYENSTGQEIIEIAGSDWRKSNPSEINSWFESQVSIQNQSREDRGLQLRRMIRLLKRFCRSRDSWNMPNGLIMTMLAVENMPDYVRDDECFYYLLENFKTRLQSSLSVYNASDSSIPREELTKSSSDADMRELRDRTEEALGKLAILHDDSCTKFNARQSWDWIFRSDGFFESYDEDNGSGDDGGDGSKSAGGGMAAGFAYITPKKPVDPQGGGRYG